MKELVKQELAKEISKISREILKQLQEEHMDYEEVIWLLELPYDTEETMVDLYEGLTEEQQERILEFVEKHICTCSTCKARFLVGEKQLEKCPHCHSEHISCEVHEEEGNL